MAQQPPRPDHALIEAVDRTLVGIPYKERYTLVRETLKKLHEQLYNNPARQTPRHDRAARAAVERWLSGQDPEAPEITPHDKTEIRSLLNRTLIHTFTLTTWLHEPGVRSHCVFEIGDWSGIAGWSHDGRYSFGPFIEDRKPDNDADPGAFCGWDTLRRLAHSRLSLGRFQYLVHLLAFDHVHHHLDPHRPPFNPYHWKDFGRDDTQ